MINIIMRVAITFAGLFLGYGASIAALFILKMPRFESMINITTRLEFIITVACIVLFGLIFYFITPTLKRTALSITKRIETDLQKVPANDILIGAIGLIIGLLIAYLISQLLMRIEIFYIGTVLSIIAYVFLGYLGVTIATKKVNDFLPPVILSNKQQANQPKKKSANANENATPKIVDTSVIIDGRILDILKTGFVEGTIIIPEFVLVELRHIADSTDALKRNRGRRGLDILNALQNNKIMDIQIVNKDYSDETEVDMKLLRLAKDMSGKVLTNDYNLNKVAELQRVDVLNINELANSIKPVVLPGEEMILTVIKEGKENKQGIAYLDDGTMIVIEEGKKYIGETLKVLVTSVLQTAAGRMIFAKPKEVIKH